MRIDVENAAQSEVVKNKQQVIPESLIYEMSKGKAIYYRGFQDYFRGEKVTEVLMGSSYLQVFIIMELIKYLLMKLPNSYQIFTNELGVIHQEGSWRLLDIAIYRKKDLQDVRLENKYLKVPPEVAIEIDTKADIEQFTSAMDYVFEKTDDLLNFGVKKVIWIFTTSKKVMTASQNEQWITTNWGESISVVDDIVINLEDILKDKF